MSRSVEEKDLLNMSFKIKKKKSNEFNSHSVSENLHGNKTLI